jgi:predicted metal-binding protein
MLDTSESQKEEKLEPHLRMLRQVALDLGASDARIISRDLLPIEDDVVDMCRAPRCEGYDQSANCPPRVMGPEAARQWLSSYRWAVLFKVDVTPELLVSPERFHAFRKIYTLASALECLSQAAGYPASRGLAAGSCKPVFCKDLPCQALPREGVCRYPYLARPSMEALGINVFQLCKEVGWEIHPILRNTDPKGVPSAMLAGLVVVG